MKRQIFNHPIILIIFHIFYQRAVVWICNKELYTYSLLVTMEQVKIQKILTKVYQWFPFQTLNKCPHSLRANKKETIMIKNQILLNPFWFQGRFVQCMLVRNIYARQTVHFTNGNLKIKEIKSNCLEFLKYNR